MDIRRIQRDLQTMGLYTGAIDGLWGPLSEAAYQRMVTVASSLLKKEVETEPNDRYAMAWGKKVSDEFKRRVIAICGELVIQDPDWLMACIAFESGESFRADIRNAAGSGATGLIQFMPATARALGTSTTALAAMTPEAQLDYVRLYFLPYKNRLKNLGDLYMAILWPRGIGKPDDWALWDRDTRPTTYRQNSGLDANRDGVITRGEAVAKIEAKLQRGRQLFHG